MTLLFTFGAGLALGLAWGIRWARARELRETARRFRELLDAAEEYERGRR